MEIGRAAQPVDHSASARPFPPLLQIGLIAPLISFAFAYVIEAAAGEKAAPLVFIFWGLGILLELIAVPAAIAMLASGGYRTRMNVVFTLLGAIPPAIVVLVVIVLFFGGVHM